MRKNLFFCSVALCLLVISDLSAQPGSYTLKYNDKVRIGLKAGTQLSAVGEIHRNSEIRFPGYLIGAALQIPLIPKYNCPLFITPELLYSSGGEKGMIKGGTSSKDVVNFYQDYITVPVMVKYYILNKLLFFESGTSASLLVYRTNKDKDLGNASYFDVGLCLGSGLNFGRRHNMEVGARINYGLLDMYRTVPARNYNISGSATFTIFFGRSN